MATNPYPKLPTDQQGVPMQHYATAASVKAVYASENASTSSVITLTHDTTVLEIAAIGALPTGAVMRWVASVTGFGAATSVVSDAAGANFAHVIPNNSVRKFAVPIEKGYYAPSSMVGANIQNGLFRRVAIKSIGVGSVIVTEY